MATRRREGSRAGTRSGGGRSGRSTPKRGSSEKPDSGRTSERTRRARRVSSQSAASGNSRHTSRTTTNHEEIRRWAEERGGRPACVQGTGRKGDTGMIRLEFPGAPRRRDASLQEIDWDEFFQKFDQNNLALVYQDTTARGEHSNFNKIVSRESARKASRAKRPKARAASA